MRSGVLVMWVTVALCVLAGPVAAQNADAMKKAQASFDTAQTEYLQGKFDEAAAGFQEAYAARPFPQFLYNVGASYHMKGKKTSDPEAYAKAVEFYKRYLTEEPDATDKATVEKAIGVLEAEIARLKQAPPAGGGSAATAAPSQEVQNLGDVKVRGLVVIITEPQNATIYLDDKKKGPFATTPWSGSLEGEHKLIIEKRGYKVVESTISADPTKLVQFVSTMAQEDYLAWIEVASNVPKSDVFIDDKSIGAVGQTPWSQQIKPGKHTFWISKEGYNEYTESIDIAPGETKEIKGTLRGTPVGKLLVSGMGIEESTISIDGKILCERGPCLRSVSSGDHELSVTRPEFKPYRRRITIDPKTETEIKVALVPTPSRSDAVVAYVVAGIFLAGGIVAGVEANDLHDQLQKEITAANPTPASDDPRFLRGKIYAIAADGAFAVSAIAAATAVYYTLRDKGPPSTALIDAKSVTVMPEVNSQYAGVGMEVHW
ncbi:MAG TPA: PEGA domain-containing protein [Kofleriaceae bacterium]